MMIKIRIRTKLWGKIDIPMNIKSKKTNEQLENIKKILVSLTKDALINLIVDLYAFSRPNKDFLETRFIQVNIALIRYKKLIQQNIAPNEPWKRNQQINLKEAKKAISDYKKATNDRVGVIEWMICDVEYGTDFLCGFGDMYEQYYSSLESMFEKVISSIKTLQKQEKDTFIQRLYAVVKKARNTGWGYYDTISDMLDEACPDLQVYK